MNTPDETWLLQKLDQLQQQALLRQTQVPLAEIDFASNDYLGLSRNETIRQAIAERAQCYPLGATGSRLLTGHTVLAEETEQLLADLFRAEAALLFSSGYAANLGLVTSVTTRHDVVLYDELIHASLRDGIRLSDAKAYRFLHNNLDDLDKQLQKHRPNAQRIFVISEGIFSMDGDAAPIAEMLTLCERNDAFLILDEAHSGGVLGTKGEGLLASMNLHKNCFARIVTFGKAFGGHGAAVLGSQTLKTYLLNNARSQIYSTALPPHSLLQIQEAVRIMPSLTLERQRVADLYAQLLGSIYPGYCLQTKLSPIVTVQVPGNEQVTQASKKLQQLGLDVRAIRHPTVAAGTERLRICLHSYNTEAEVNMLISSLKYLAS